MPSHSGRRRFLRQAAAALAALGANQAGSSLAAEKENKKVDGQALVPIVDTHQHLWDTSKFRLAWHKDHPTLAKSFLMSDYLAAAKGLNVVQTVYMEVDVDPAQHVQEAEYVLDLCRRDDNPMTAAVIGGRPASAEFKDYILKFKGNPFIKGVRQVLHNDGIPAGNCLDKQFVKSVQLLGELGMSFDLCMRSGELLDGDKLVAQCPRTRFIVDHCGNMSVQETDAKKRQKWMDGMKALAQRPNTVCKISGIIVTAKPGAWKPADLQPNVTFALDTFGKERSMFAGDWPVCTLTAPLRQWVEALKEIVHDRSPADQRLLFHDNAVRFYGLNKPKTAGK
jgi:L-fuconolactonase